jgi:hypothetical protein
MQPVASRYTDWAIPAPNNNSYDDKNNNNNNKIQLFIYLLAELNSQWPITESARIETTLRQHRTKQTKNNRTQKLIS